MPSPLRTGLIAGVAVALVLSLPSAAAARPRPADEGTTRGYTHAQARAILGRVERAVTRAPAARTDPARDLTLQLRDLRRALPALDSKERTLALGLIGLVVPPPSSSCGGGLFDAAIRTTHFCVHDAGNRPWAQTTADTLEHVWAVEVDGLGYRHPPLDGDGLFDVYLEEIGNRGYYGACAPAQNARHSTSSCVLDDDFDPAEFGGAPALNSLSVTAAHEFFHAIQFGYDTDEDTWLMEGSAVWAEEQVYPAINDYLQYLRFSAITHPETPEDYSGASSADLFYRYGAVLFWKFLAGQFGGPAIVRRVWEYADGERYSLEAVAGALGERGWSFGRAFARFGVWNTLPAGSYDDRELYPATPWWQVQDLSRRHRATGTRTVVLNHLSNAAMLIQPSGRLRRHTKLRISVDGPALAGIPQAAVQVRRRDGTVKVVDLPLNGAGDGSTLVRFDRRTVGAIAVTLTNASTRMTACGTDPAWLYSCGGQSIDDGLPFSISAKVKLPRHR